MVWQGNISYDIAMRYAQGRVMRSGSEASLMNHIRPVGVFGCLAAAPHDTSVMVCHGMQPCLLLI